METPTINFSGGKKKLPHRTLKITTLSIIYTLLGLVAIIFMAKSYFFYQKIKSGDGLSLAMQFDDAFTKSKTAAPTPAVVNSAILTRPNNTILGRGAVTVVEFADFECPFSAEEYSTFRELALKYQDKIKFVFRHLPLTDLHPHAADAAMAALCANEQGKFWPMHDKLFANNTHLENADLLRYATEIGLDQGKFIICTETKKYQKQLDQDVADAAALGAIGTPTFFIDGQKIEGAIPANIFDKILSSIIQSTSTK